MIRWKPFGPYITALLAIAASLYYNHTKDTALHESRVVAAQAVVAMYQAVELADSANAAAARANDRANALEHARAAATPAVAAVVKAAPDTCKPVIAALQGQLAKAQDEAEARKVSYEDQKVATAALRPASEHLAEATHNLVNKSHTSFLGHLVPRFGVGAAAGVSVLTRKPEVVVGVTMSWGH